MPKHKTKGSVAERRRRSDEAASRAEWRYEIERAEQEADSVPVLHNENGVTAETSAARRANGVGPDTVQAGMAVLSQVGEPIGKVNQVRADDFLLDRPNARALYVPFHACHSVEAGRLTLAVSGAQLEAQGWPELNVGDVLTD